MCMHMHVCMRMRMHMDMCMHIPVNVLRACAIR